MINICYIEHKSVDADITIIFSFFEVVSSNFVMTDIDLMWLCQYMLWQSFYISMFCDACILTLVSYRMLWICSVDSFYLNEICQLCLYCLKITSIVLFVSMLLCFQLSFFLSHFSQNWQLFINHNRYSYTSNKMSILSLHLRYVICVHSQDNRLLFFSVLHHWLVFTSII